MAIWGGPWESNPTAHRVLVLVQFFSPVALMVVLILAFIYHGVTKSKSAEEDEPQPLGPGGKPLPRNLSPAAKAKKAEKELDFSSSRKWIFKILSICVLLTLVGNAAVVIVHALLRRRENWWCGQSFVVYNIGFIFIYSLVLMSIFDTKPSPSVIQINIWVLGFGVEAIVLIATATIYNSPHREPKAGSPAGGRLRTGTTTWETLELFLDGLRLLCLSAMICLYFTFLATRRLSRTSRRHAENGDVEETTNLLDGHLSENGNTNGHTYGTAREYKQNKDAKKVVEETEGWVRQKVIPEKTWWEYVRAYSLFIPYIWPAKERRLQMLFLACCVLVAIQRIVNVLVPIQAGKITDILSGDDSPRYIPWSNILLYIGFKMLQGNSGLITGLREWLWIPVSQYCFRELSVSSFEHVHSLSLDFHLGKKTGEIMSALNKGASLNSFLSQVTFTFAPMMLDLGVAIGYFLIGFDAYYALVVTLITFAYVYLTIRLAQGRTKIKREMANLERDNEAVKNDSMTSYETVKYFNAEDYEFNRYRNTIKTYQAVEYKNQLSLNTLNLSQNLCFTLGLLITCFIAAFQVATGQRKVGQFVALLTMMTQLQGPLNYLGSFYKGVQSSMINAERLLELFKVRPTVVDHWTAQDLETCVGEISFNDVRFSYDDRRPALNGVSFTCAPGTTTAFVGESGGGKSTVFRLLFRFYNLVGGDITVDGRRIQDITIDSLRRHIGVVPQDTVLFNETLMYNLKYANQNASDEEVYEACKAASIHDQIESFTDGYDSKVGERGLKLSGGEKQRIAIARTILKGPRIILLDEATAALDSETEEHIEAALDALSDQRTTLIIAHRLSTITTADQIVVLHRGQVAEVGNHEELLERGGRYAKMWSKQGRAERMAKEARRATARADRLLQQATASSSASQSDDERSHVQKRGRPPPESTTTISLPPNNDEIEADLPPGLSGHV